MTAPSPELVRAGQATQSALHGLQALVTVAKLRDFISAHDLTAELVAIHAENPDRVIVGDMTAKRMLDALQLAEHIDRKAFGIGVGEELTPSEGLALRNRLIV